MQLGAALSFGEPSVFFVAWRQTLDLRMQHKPQVQRHTKISVSSQVVLPDIDGATARREIEEDPCNGKL